MFNAETKLETVKYDLSTCKSVSKKVFDGEEHQLHK